MDDSNQKLETTTTPESASQEAPVAAATEGQQPRERGPRRGPGGHGGRRGPRGPRQDRGDDVKSEFVERSVHVNRCASVSKGGRSFSFSSLMVVGDGKGRIGIGFGKANEVADASRKATDRARKNVMAVNLKGGTLPHEVLGEFDGARVLLRPASPGTGLIAGGGVRAVLEVAGVKDVLSKSLGSNNPNNLVKATMMALQQLRPREEILRLRGRKVKSAATTAS
jgi:small subunit ribosomal protein S5